jgi:hypothetical protein
MKAEEPALSAAEGMKGGTMQDTGFKMQDAC